MNATYLSLSGHQRFFHWHRVPYLCGFLHSGFYLFTVHFIVTKRTTHVWHSRSWKPNHWAARKREKIEIHFQTWFGKNHFYLKNIKFHWIIHFEIRPRKILSSSHSAPYLCGSLRCGFDLLTLYFVVTERKTHVGSGCNRKSTYWVRRKREKVESSDF